MCHNTQRDQINTIEPLNSPNKNKNTYKQGKIGGKSVLTLL